MNPKNRKLVIGVVVAVLLLCCCCVVGGGILVVVDPFGWGLLSFLPGRGETVSAAIPAETPLYSTMDLTALASPKAARILRAFADVPGVSEYAGTDNVMAELDKNLQQELGLTVTDDIVPWVGRYAGVSISQIPQNADNPSDMDFVVMVEARDVPKAEAFVTKFVEALAQKSGATPAEASYKGVTVHTVAQSSGAPVVVALSKSLLLLSPSESALQLAIDAQSGAAPSAAKAAEYARLRRQLPGDSLLTLVAGGPALQAYLQDLQNAQGGLSSNLDATQAGLEAMQSVGLALSVVDEGIRVDTAVMYDETQLPDTLRQWYAASGDDQTANLFPENTLVHLSGQRPDLAWAIFREAMNPVDFKDAMQAFENQFGFNPDEALLPYLQSGAGVALIPDADSPLTAMEAGDFGFAALLGTNDAAAMGEVLTAFNGSLEEQGLTIDSRTVGGQAAYVLNSGGQPLVVYGVGQDYLALASSEPVFAGLFSQAASLSKSDDYQKVWRAFPAGMRHGFYADVTGLVDLARQSMPSESIASFDEEVLPYLKPVSVVASGSTPLKNGVVQTTFIVFIEGGQ